MLQKRQASVAGARRIVLIGCLILAQGLGLVVGPASGRPVGESPGQLGGVVTDGDGEPVAGVTADLFRALDDGARDAYLATTTTGADGAYRFAAEDGCYVVVLIAPTGQEFARSGRYVQGPVCVVDGLADRTVDGLLPTAAATLSGRVVDTFGAPVAQVAIDLFHATESNLRADYLTSTATGADGSYTLSVPEAGCYVVVVIAPDGNRFDGGATTWRRGSCVDAGDRIDGLEAVVGQSATSRIGGRVANGPTGGVVVDVFVAAGDGSRGAHVGTTSTGSDGRYRFDLDPACYVVVLIAPAGARFTETGPFRQLDACVGSGEEVAGLDATLARRAPSRLSPVELEIAVLTNRLRADPSGPLARRAPMPTCVDEPFYEISLDPVSGHPEPVPPLDLSEIVSIEMARAWAIDMFQRGAFLHRPSASQQQIYDRLGVEVTAWGENIAWLSGYSSSEAARVHFEGWRESDTGHYCSLVTDRFSHLGVGEVRIGDESWAVQNFYAPRRSASGAEREPAER